MTVCYLLLILLSQGILVATFLTRDNENWCGSVIDRCIIFRYPENSKALTVGNLKKTSLVRKLLGQSVENARFYQFPDVTMQGHAHFRTDPTSGDIKAISMLDREQVCPRQSSECCVKFSVSLDAKKSNTDSSFPRSIILHVRVIIEDKNDNPPEFSQRSLNRKVAENSKVGSVIRLPQAKDADTPANGVVEYTMNDTDGVFELHTEKKRNSRGQMMLYPYLKQVRKLDRERKAEYTYTLWARDNAGHKGSLPIHIKVRDVNDNVPKWEKSPYNIEMLECHPTSKPLLTLRATDADDDTFGQVRYSISTSADHHIHNMFYVNGDKLYSNDNPDFEQITQVTVPLVAEDGGSLQSQTEVIIDVKDCNDHRPTIVVRPAQYNFDSPLGLGLRNPGNPTIKENARGARLVATLLVSDKDSGENGRTSCQLEDPENTPFDLKEQVTSGGKTQIYDLITLINTVYDREKDPRYRVTVKCRDFGDKPMDNSQTLLVEVQDENDNPPKFAKPLIRLQIYEDNHVGDYVGSLVATDPDAGQNGVVSYELDQSEAAQGFRIDTQGSLRALRRFDREARDSYRFHVIARDNGQPQSLNTTATVLVNILDVNDNAPRFQKDYQFSVTEARGNQRLASVLLGRLNATDPDAGANGTLHFSLTEFIPNQCRHCFIISRDGTLRITGNIDRERVAQYRFKALAVDDGYPVSKTGSTWVLVTVLDLNDNPPVFIFPNGRNNTVKLPADTPVGHVVAQIHAEDPDEGRNKEIIFALTTISKNYQLESDGRLILRHALEPKGSRGKLGQSSWDTMTKLVIRAENPKKDNKSISQVSIEVLKILVQRPRRIWPGISGTGSGVKYPSNRGSGIRGDDSGPMQGSGGGRRTTVSRSNSLLLLILTAASVVVFILVVTIFALVYLRKIPCQGSSTAKRRRRPPGEEEKGGSAGVRQEELFPIQHRPGGMEIDKMGCVDHEHMMTIRLGEKTLRKGPPPNYSAAEKGSAPSLMDRQASSGGNYAYIPAPAFDTLDRNCGSGADSSEAEMTGTGKLSRKCYRPAGAESHAYTELEVRDVLLPEFAGKESPTATYQNTLKQCSNSHWALNNTSTAQRTPVITSSFV